MLRFFRPRSPVAPETEAWLRDGYLWLVDAFGAAPSRRPPLCPTPDDVPWPFDGSAEALEPVLDMAAERVEVPRDDLALVVHEDSDPHGDFMHATGAQGSWSTPTNSDFSLPDAASSLRHTIEMPTSVAADPTAAVAALAHGVCSARLLAFGIEGEGDTLVDLATVFFGFGVFTANSIFQESNWQGASQSGWSMRRLGNLTYPEAGFALALHATARGERKPSWARYLRPDARSPFQKALRVLGE
ncbi:MAG: hypothetical protein AAFU73_18305 [Planctomycetota bacterium]